VTGASLFINNVKQKGKECLPADKFLRDHLENLHQIVLDINHISAFFAIERCKCSKFG